MFTEFGVLSQDAQTMLNLTISVTDFGNDDTATPETTQLRTQRERNRKLVNSATRFNAMAQSYNYAVNIDFQNADELEATEQQLEEKYQALINDNNLSDELNDQMIDLRESVHDFMQEQTDAAVKIATITDIKVQPMSILAYNYYGSTDNAESLVALNKIVNVPFVSGTLRILTP